MDELKKMQFNTKALLKHVNSDTKFFSAIISIVDDLYKALNTSPIDIDEIKFLIESIDDFYERYRDSGDSDGIIYIPPHQTSNSNSLVIKLKSSIPQLKVIKGDSLSNTEDTKVVQLCIYDEKLIKACKTAYESKDWWDLVFKATRHLEVRIRKKANLTTADTGIDLVNKAFNKDSGKLKIPSCSVPAEEEGFFLILRGIVMFHRNVKGHNEGTIEKERAVQIVNYVDYLLDMIETAVIR